MTVSRWLLVAVVVIAGAAAIVGLQRGMPDRIGSVLDRVFPPKDPATLRARAELLATPVGPRTITVQMPVVPGAGAWSDLSAQARFFAGPPSCLRKEWSRGTVAHGEWVNLPVVPLGDNRFAVTYHDQLLAPADLYGRGRCGWFPEGVRLIARAVPDRATGQRWQASIQLGPEAVLDPEPQNYACLAAKGDGVEWQCLRRDTAGPLLEPLPEVVLRVAKVER